MLNEFRQDLVSGEWVLFATGRAGGHIDKTPKNGALQADKDCPFDDPHKTGQEILWGYPDDKNWEIMVIKNKYPAVKPGMCGSGSKAGPFEVHDAMGDHDVIVYKDHDTQFADFSSEKLVSVIRTYKKRFVEIAESRKDCTQYVLIFHNHGPEAGASIVHPHSQIISLPILPPDVTRSLRGSHQFYKDNDKRVYDIIIRWELEQKKRIVYENDLFVAFCPFVSKFPYEIRIFPRDSHAHFDQMPDTFDKYFADAMSVVLRKIKKSLNNPSYNFFIHTSPIRIGSPENFHEFYTWHIEFIPKLSMAAGFEIGTGVDINVVDPDEAAELFRNTEI